MITQTDSQCKRILEFLQEYGSITPLEALQHFGCFRLGARIHDLRNAGYIIETVPEKKNGKCFARYILKGEPNE